MPQRMIDGDAISRSKKLKEGVSERWRVHYAYWLTLAEANGVFECDADQIHARLYAYLAPDVKISHVRQIIRQFIGAGVLTTWEENGRTWGFFPGNEKPGRLPVPAHRKRYKNLPPDCPGLVPDLSRTMPAGFEVERIGTERSGLEPGQSPANQFVSSLDSTANGGNKETLMQLKRFVKLCVPLWQEHFGPGAMLRLPTLSKQDLEFMTEAYDIDLLLDAFRLFAKDHFENGGSPDPFAVAKFVSRAPEYMLKVCPAKVSTQPEEQAARQTELTIKQAKEEFSRKEVKPRSEVDPDDFLKTE